MDHLFAFALDGKADLWSINPLELTNYEATGTAFAVIGVVIALLLDLARHRRLTGADSTDDVIYLPHRLEDSFDEASSAMESDR